MAGQATRAYVASPNPASQLEAGFSEQAGPVAEGVAVGWPGLDSCHNTNLTTAAGGTIKAMMDFAMMIPPKDEAAGELFPSIGMGASVYGDPSGTYAVFLSCLEQNYPTEPWSFWNQLLSNSGWEHVHAGTTGAATLSGMVIP